MEVGKHRTRDPKIETGIDKDVRFSGSGTDLAVRRLACRRFQGADAGGADSDDAALLCSCAIDLLRGCFADLVALAMHDVVLHPFGVDGLECAEAYVQRHNSALNTTIIKGPEDLGREMQTSGWCRDRSAFAGIDSLVALSICSDIFPLDIRWQRYVADLLDDRKEIVDGIKAQCALAEFTASR